MKKAESSLSEEESALSLRTQRHLQNRTRRACRALNLPDPTSVEMSALDLIEKHLRPKGVKVVSSRIAAAIYTACKFEGYDVAVKDVIKATNTSHNAVKLCIRFFKNRLQESGKAKKKPATVVDYMDLEKGGVIPPGLAVQFLKENTEMRGFVDSALTNRMDPDIREQYIFALCTMVSYSHHTGEDLPPDKVDTWFSPAEKERFLKVVPGVLKSLEFLVIRWLPWLQRSKQSNCFAKKLDIVLQHRSLLEKSSRSFITREGPRVAKAEDLFQISALQKKAAQNCKAVKSDEHITPEPDEDEASSLILDEVWTALQRAGVTPTSARSAQSIVTKMYRLLYHSQMAHHCQHYPESVCAALAHQSVSIYESQIPTLCKVFTGPAYSYLMEMDHLIRLAAMKLALLYNWEELPFDIANEDIQARLVQDMPKFYPRLVGNMNLRRAVLRASTASSHSSITSSHSSISSNSPHSSISSSQSSTTSPDSSVFPFPTKRLKTESVSCASSSSSSSSSFSPTFISKKLKIESAASSFSASDDPEMESAASSSYSVAFPTKREEVSHMGEDAAGSSRQTAGLGGQTADAAACTATIGQFNFFCDGLLQEIVEILKRLSSRADGGGGMPSVLTASGKRDVYK